MKAFADFARAKVKQEGGDTEEPERERMRSQTFQYWLCTLHNKCLSLSASASTLLKVVCAKIVTSFMIP